MQFLLIYYLIFIRYTSEAVTNSHLSITSYLRWGLYRRYYILTRKPHSLFKSTPHKPTSIICTYSILDKQMVYLMKRKQIVSSVVEWVSTIYAYTYAYQFSVFDSSTVVVSIAYACTVTEYYGTSICKFKIFNQIISINVYRRLPDSLMKL